MKKVELPPGVMVLTGRDAIYCVCREEHCGKDFIVFDDRTGQLRCPRCFSAEVLSGPGPGALYFAGQGRIQGRWGKLEIVFVPEGAPDEITTDMRGPRNGEDDGDG